MSTGTGDDFPSCLDVGDSGAPCMDGGGTMMSAAYYTILAVCGGVLLLSS